MGEDGVIGFIIDKALYLSSEAPCQGERVGDDCNFEVWVFAEHKCREDNGCSEAFSVLRGDGDDESLDGSFGKSLEQLVVGFMEGRPVELGIQGRGEGDDGASSAFGSRFFQFDERLFVFRDSVFAGRFCVGRLVFGVISGHGGVS